MALVAVCSVQAPDSEGRQETLHALVTAITAAAPRHQQLRAGHDLQPTCATSNPAQRATNLLSEVDRAAQAIVGEPPISMYECFGTG